MSSIIYVKTSQLTGVKHRREIPMNKTAFMKAHNAWNDGMLIQDAFPGLSAEDREFIMTGITPDEWDSIFGEEQ